MRPPPPNPPLLLSCQMDLCKDLAVCRIPYTTLLHSGEAYHWLLELFSGTHARSFTDLRKRLTPGCVNSPLDAPPGCTIHKQT